MSEPSATFETSTAAPGSPRLEQVTRVHLVGIGGSGMGALAGLLLDLGKTVSGSELRDSPAVAALRGRGARIFPTHAAANVADAEYVIRSAAVPADNVEVVAAEARGVPTRKLAEVVGELMTTRRGVAVAGTHGKTTTTALIAWLLDRAGLDPLVLIGADTPAYPQGARVGTGPLVVEADEYDRRFLQYWPEVAVVTGIEADHLDYFRDLTEIEEVFGELVGRLPAAGRLIACADDPLARELRSPARLETYGFARDAGWRVDDFAPVPDGGARFTLRVDGRAWEVRSPLVGEHNARNVAAALAATEHFGVGLRTALAALAAFQGPRRRFETRGRPGGIWVVDDYAHHPTELRAVLRAARAVVDGEVWAVFQPHTTNRTAALLEEFAGAFGDAGHVLVLPIYQLAGRELAARPVTSGDLVGRVRALGHPDACEVADFAAAEEVLRRRARAGDVVLTLGAGDVTRLGGVLVEALEG